MATDKDPPLYLHVTATTQDILDQAVAKINELIDEAQNPAPHPPQHQSFRQQPGVPAGGPPVMHPIPYDLVEIRGLRSRHTF